MRLRGTNVREREGQAKISGGQGGGQKTAQKWIKNKVCLYLHEFDCIHFAYL